MRYVRKTLRRRRREHETPKRARFRCLVEQGVSQVEADRRVRVDRSTARKWLRQADRRSKGARTGRPRIIPDEKVEETGRTAVYQPSGHALFLSVLCSLCLNVFRQVNEQTNNETFRFYSASELLKAKSTRCSFCTLLLSSIRKRQTENEKGAEKLYETKSRRPLIAEIQHYHKDLGFSFNLWHHKKEVWDFLTSVTLKFSDAEIWFGKGYSLKTCFMKVTTKILFRTPEENF